MKAAIPADLKQDLPQNQWGKILSVTPVVMTVVATLLAGLASSEMTRAQYERAYGAQLQSKAGDQWGYFQAKKLRGAMQRTSMDQLRATADIRPLDGSRLSGDAGAPVLAALVSGKVSAVPGGPQADPAIVASITAVEGNRPEPEIADLLDHVTDASLAGALAKARDDVAAFDAAIKPVGDGIDRIEETVAPDDKALHRDVAFARIRYNANRYDLEARMNQSVANILELQVRKANIAAEHHHRRSGKFFLGMLGAQAAVIVSTLAVAARKRNFMWTIAAVVGVAAVAFAVYVYIKV